VRIDNSTLSDNAMNPTPFKLERYFAAHEFTAKHLLCSSDPESVNLSKVLALEPGSEEGLRDIWLGYTEYPGALALREELAKRYASVTPDHFIVHTGAQEAIFSFMNSVLSPGDHIIVQMPGYQSHYSVAQSMSVEVSAWRVREENGWSFSVEELSDLLRPETKALVICAPHNPTGYLPSASEFTAIVEFARRHDLILFSDEVYRGLEYDEADRLPAACDAYERGVSLSCLSKSHGLAGLRLGWVATRDADVLERMSHFKDYLSISNSAPSEYLGRIAVRHSDVLIERAVSITRSNLAALDAFFLRHQRTFQWHRPRAGTIAFPRLTQGAADAFCSELLKEPGILLLPSTLVDYGNSHFRIGFGRKSTKPILALFESFLDGRD
jgi:aspartate/methionine/tyrosine aminotransferase